MLHTNRNKRSDKMNNARNKIDNNKQKFDFFRTAYIIAQSLIFHL